MNSRVIELPIELENAIAVYLKNNPSMSVNDLAAASIALFLVQNGHADPNLSRVYLTAIFGNVINF